ncbi:phage tail tape measure protein [Streptomyces sp. NPDC006458]|uniref:phage tail tape measure protein n=1 Tax=Streptomyces sp. NPDC006458 TaxID=3154302 RepID=UPI0033ADFB0D
MALTVGELNAILSVDDRAVDPALRRVENAMRNSGERMGDDAERAGEEAGEQLGEGLVRGADGRLRNARGRFVGAGRRAGDAVGDGLADGVAEGADEAVAEAESGLSRLQMVALAAGAAGGAILMDAFGQALDQEQITVRLGATLGKTPEQARRYGQIAGQLYSHAITEDFQAAADAIGATIGSGLIDGDATSAEIEKVSAKVATLSDLFGQELPQVANAATQLIRTGLAKDATEALDLVAAGFSTNINKSDDFLDTLNEYSVQFKRVGLDGQTSIGLMTQAIAKGARDSDQVADAIGQFGEIALAGGKSVEDAFKSIGLDSDKIAAKLQRGGKSGQEALQMTTDALRNAKDETVALNAAGALFGDPGKVMGDALFALDPASAAAASGMDKAAGAMDRLGKGVHDTAAANIEQFQRGAMQRLVEFIGGEAIPAVLRLGRFVREHSLEFKIAALVITGVLVPALVLMGVTATVAAGRVVWGWITTGAAAIKSAAIQTGAALRTAGAWVMMQVRAVGSFLAIAASATATALRTAAVWAASAARMTATWLVSILRVAAVTVAQYALMAARAVAWAAVVAAQWLIAMGPVGWVIAVVIGLVALVIAKWDLVKRWTGIVWGWIVQKISDSVGRVLAVVTWMSKIPGWVSGWFQSAKDWAVTKALALVAWMMSWPGRINAAIGSLKDLLIEKGKDVVRGLWAGIQSMGSWLASKVASFAADNIPGPIADILGIASPSKVTKEQGQWIAKGLVVGLTGEAKAVKAAATRLADIVYMALGPGRARSRALSRISADSKRLLDLASQESRVADRLRAAQAKVAETLKERDKLAADVRRGILDSANITQGTGPQTAQGILARLQRDRVQADQFTKNLAKLEDQGVRADLIAQIAAAGVDQGSATAAALATATPGQIKAINSEQAALVKTAGTAGKTAADAMYATGIAAGQGLIRGLKSQQTAIEQQMLVIARGMSKAIRKELGIKSPSRVMARLGAFIPAGLRRGIESGRRAVDRSMASLVATPTPRELSVSTAAGGQARAGGVDQRAYTTNNHYNLTTRPITMQEFDGLQRRQDALARVGRPR